MKVGEKMSFQDIQKVTETEQNVRARKTEAQAEAKQIIASAQRSGAAMVEEARVRAEAEVKAIMAEAEELAAGQSKEALAANEAACQAMRVQAEKRLEQAADLIVRRVVNR